MLGLGDELFQTHLLLFTQTLSFQRATEGSVGNQSTPQCLEDVAGISAGLQHKDSPAQPVGSSHHLWVQEQPCVPQGDLAPLPCPGGHRLAGTQHSQAFLRQLPVKAPESQQQWK